MNEDIIRKVNKRFYNRYEPEAKFTYWDFMIEYLKIE